MSVVRIDNIAVKSVAKSLFSDETIRNFLSRASTLNTLISTSSPSKGSVESLIVWSVSNPSGRTLEFQAPFISSGSLYDIIQVYICSLFCV